MHSSSFFSAACGRLLLATAAFASIAAGLVVASAQRSPGMVALVVLVCVAPSILAVGTAIERFPWIALALVLGLPVIGALYFAGIYALAGAAQPIVGGALVLLGIVAASRAMRGMRHVGRPIARPYGRVSVQGR